MKHCSKIPRLRPDSDGRAWHDKLEALGHHGTVFSRKNCHFVFWGVPLLGYITCISIYIYIYSLYLSIYIYITTLTLKKTGGPVVGPIHRGTLPQSGALDSYFIHVGGGTTLGTLKDIYIHTYIHIFTYIYTYIYSHIHIHIHIHKYLYI